MSGSGAMWKSFFILFLFLDVTTPAAVLPFGLDPLPWLPHVCRDGEHVARLGDAPWQVSVQITEGGRWTHLCGGTLIADMWVLTAATCVLNRSVLALRVVLGTLSTTNLTKDAQIIWASDIVQPLGYVPGPTGLRYNVALIKLETAPSYSWTVSKIALSSSTANFTGSSCVVSGWSKIHLDSVAAVSLRIADIDVIDNEMCQYWWGGFIIGENSICGQHDTATGCETDNGGPLACYTDGGWRLAGVTSFMHGACTRRFPVVFSGVAPHRDWIDSTLSRH